MWRTLKYISSSFPDLQQYFPCQSQWGQLPHSFRQTIPRPQTTTQNSQRCSLTLTSAVGKEGGPDICASLCFFGPPVSAFPTRGSYVDSNCTW